MLMSDGDLADKYTILSLKKIHGAEPGIDGELTLYRTAMSEARIDPKLIQELFDKNKAIWKLEAAIRAGRDSDMTLEEVGRRALAIRDMNRDRIAVKNKINLAAGDPAEVKINHCSATP